MTCINIGNAIVCCSPWGRLKVGNRYITMDYHPYCGPTFYYDRAMTKVYEPVDENDPVWDEFTKWLVKYNAKKEKLNAAK